MLKNLFSISTKILLAVALFLCFLGIGTYYALTITTNVLKENISSQVVSIGESRKNEIQIYLAELSFNADVLANLNLVSDSLKSGSYNEVTDLLIKVHEANDLILHIDIINAEGIVVASSLDTKVGSDKSESSVFTEGKKGLFYNNIHRASVNNQPAFGVSVPVLSSGEIIGVLLIDLQADRLHEIVGNSEHLGELGETYLIDNTNLMVSPSRFDAETFLTKKVDDLFKNCSTHSHREHEGTLTDDSYINYRGIKTLWTHEYIDEMDICLVVNLNAEETYLNTKKDLNLTYYSIFIAGVLFLIIIWLFSFLTISQPIKNLAKTINSISQGNLEGQIKETSRRDEVGDLARAFSRTLVSLKLAMKQEEESKENPPPQIQ